MRRSFNLSPSLDFCNLLHPGEKIYRSQFYWFYAYKPGKCQKSVYISSPNWLHVTMSACKKIRFWQKFSFFVKSIYNCQISFVLLRPSGKSSAVSCPYGLSLDPNLARDKVSLETKCPQPVSCMSLWTFVKKLGFGKNFHFLNFFFFEIF